MSGEETRDKSQLFVFIKCHMFPHLRFRCWQKHGICFWSEFWTSGICFKSGEETRDKSQLFVFIKCHAFPHLRLRCWHKQNMKCVSGLGSLYVRWGNARQIPNIPLLSETKYKFRFRSGGLHVRWGNAWQIPTKSQLFVFIKCHAFPHLRFRCCQKQNIEFASVWSLHVRWEARD